MNIDSAPGRVGRHIHSGFGMRINGAIGSVKIMGLKLIGIGVPGW